MSAAEASRRARTRLGYALALLLLPLVALSGTTARGDVGEAADVATADRHRLLALGTLHTCAITDNGGVECWGNNDQGQLGNGTVATASTPQPVPGLTGVRQVVGGAHHTCALRHGGSVRCWGLGGSGQLGNGDPHGADATLPVPVAGLEDASALAAGGFHTCALRVDGTVSCWGQDGMGQLGDGAPGDYAIAPMPVPDITAANPATALAAGEFHTCATLEDGTVRCWGANFSGQLGDGTTEDRAVPTAVAGLPDVEDHPALAVTAGNAHTCVVVDDPFRVWCWGLNTYGQLGHATTDDEPSPTPLVVQHDANPDPLVENLQELPGAVSVAAGEFHTCALVASSARCWGMNGHHQLGADPKPLTDEVEDSTHAVAVPGLTADAVVAGGHHTCAVDGNQVRCWGYNFHGQLGSYADQSSELVAVTAVTGALEVAAGTDFACAIAEADIDRRAFCWGSNADGRLGASSPVSLSTIRLAVDGLGDVDDVDLGNGHACTRLSGSATLRCWGRNLDGELGDGTTTSRDAPVVSVGDVTAYDAGGTLVSGTEHGTTCAVRGDTTVSCWGENGHGQLGDNSTMDRSSPVTVLFDSDPDPDEETIVPLSGATDVAVGGAHACALLSDTRVRCWGLNADGQIGDNTMGTERHLAVLVQDDTDEDDDSPLTGVADLVAGAHHTCAQMSDGSARCWGANGSGQLGDETTTTRPDASEPVRSQNGPTLTVGDLDGVVDLASGDHHVCALRTDRGVVCWGDDTHGQAGGGGSHGTYLVPIPDDDLDGPLVLDLAASRENTCLVFIDTTVQCVGDNSHGQLGDGIGIKSMSPLLVGALPSVGGNHIPEPQNDVVETTPGTAVTIDVLGNDSDPDGDPLTLVEVGTPVTGSAAVVGDQVEYTPGPGCYDETFTYVVSDGQAPVTATVTVLMNCPPTPEPDAVTTAEETAVDVDVLANDTDPEDDPLTVTAIGAPDHGTAEILPGGQVRYTPAQDFCSPPDDVFGYTVSDGQGHETTSFVTVTVTCLNDGPQPGADVAVTDEDAPVTVDVLANDTDPDGDALTLQSVGAATHGTTQLVEQKARYAPAPDFCGADSFTYVVTDGTTQSTGTVDVTVSCGPDDPVARADVATTDEDTAVDVDVLANDTDPDGGTLTLTGVADPGHGTAAVVAGLVRYTPAPDYCGPDAFTYQVTGAGGSAVGAVEVQVACLNDPPGAVDDLATTDEDQTVHVHVLTNDVDADGDELAITAAGGAANGTVALAVTQAVAYTPDPGWCGDDTFTYTVSDGNGGTDQATVFVTVACVNDPVTADPVADQTGPWGDQLVVTLEGQDGDDPPDPLTWTLVSGPDGSSVVSSGEFRWTPSVGQLGAHPVTVAVSDGASTAQRSFKVRVTRRPTALAYDGATSGQTSDPATVAAVVIDAGNGQPIVAAGVEFALGSATAEAATGPDGRSTTAIAVTGAAGSREVSASFPGDAGLAPSSASASFTVEPESATVSVQGQGLFLTDGDGRTVTLQAEVAEEPDGSLAGALSSVVVAFRDADGALLCEGTASPVSPGRARASCAADLAVGSRAVVATATSPTYAALADAGVVTVANTGSGFASVGGGTGARDVGFQARPVRKSAPLGDAVAVIPTPAGPKIVTASLLTGLDVACSGKTKTCAAELSFVDAAVRSLDPVTGTVGPVVGLADAEIHAVDVSDPGAGQDTWAWVVTGAVEDVFADPAAQEPLAHGNARVER